MKPDAPFLPPDRVELPQFDFETAGIPRFRA